MSKASKGKGHTNGKISKPYQVVGGFSTDRDCHKQLTKPSDVDITGRKETEESLAEVNDLQSTLIENLPYPSMLINRGRTVIFANKAAREVGAMVGGKCWQHFAHSDYISDRDKACIKKHKGKPPDGIQCTFCLADESLNESKTTVATEIHAFGRIWDIYWIPVSKDVFLHYTLDVTEHKQAEQEKQHLMDTLADKTKEMESLLRIVSHDLRSPLVNIQGFSNELMADCQQISGIISKIEMDEQTKKTVSAIANEFIPESTKYIETNVKKMDDLLKGLSQLSKVGRVELEIEPLDMNKLMTDIIESENFRTRKLNASVEYEHLPNCLGDKSQINQVFSNLLDNALKYLDSDRDGQIKIYAKVENDRSIYCVEDNGIGIPESHKSKIFEIFHRVDPNVKVKGEGLGLTTVKQIVERQNGSIWLESEIGKGSRFFVSLPAVPFI